MTTVAEYVEAVSPYTVGTSSIIAPATFTITPETYAIFAAQAARQVAIDDPGSLLSSEESNLAQAYYVCHLIAQRHGLAGKVSESGIGRYGYSRGSNAGLTAWLDSYHSHIAGIKNAPVDLTSSDYTDGYTRDDATMNGLALDQSPPYDLDDEVRTE